LDRDTARRRSSLRATLFDFAEHRLDLLVGTQMLAKGHDFPNVTTVGVVAADAGLSFPDFRSAERTFQLLIQVAGRAGRGTAPGRVVIQSFYPNNYVLRCAQRQDYKAFYDQEIDFRRLMGYPPYRNLIQILTVNPNADKAARMAEKISHTLKLYVDQRGAGSTLRILGPAAAPLEKLRGNYRMQLLVKYHPGADAISILQDCFADLSRQRFQSSKVHVDIDPLSLL
jgi:primosomal protein N' (replication factor Y)